MKLRKILWLQKRLIQKACFDYNDSSISVTYIIDKGIKKRLQEVITERKGYVESEKKMYSAMLNS